MHRPRQKRPWHRSTQHHVLLEYANLRSTCPDGLYMSLTPGKPTQWAGVLFVRKGPYAPAVLRFHVSFPPGYPDLPPMITFITDIFHPLVTPVTSYSASTPDSGAKSAADEQRLPPGAFGLADAFPPWFGASERSTTISIPSSHNAVVQAEPSEHGKLPSTTSEVQSSAEQVPPRPSMASVLNYLKRSFDDSDVLNRLPAEAATNPGAWKAWQAYRVSIEVTSSAQTDTVQDKHKSQSLKSQARHPDDWSWEGVWERRVRKGVDASISDQVLFGASGGDEMIRFVPTSDTSVDARGAAYAPRSFMVFLD